MSIFSRASKFLAGLALMAACYRKLDFRRLLRGKRIAIVGPAGSAFERNAGDYIDAFDLVIRLNKAPHMIQADQHHLSVGTKTDILFHSFMENEISGGGALDFELYDRLGIVYVINPIPTYIGWRVTLNYYKKYLSPRRIYRLSYRPYKLLQQRIGGYRPTTGMSALFRVLESDFSELYITGFTFFKTAYADGYRDQMKESAQVVDYLKTMKIHDADLEFEEFRRLLAANRRKTIIMDNALSQIIANEK